MSLFLEYPMICCGVYDICNHNSSKYLNKIVECENGSVDLQKASELFIKASQQNHPLAHYNLARLYEEGKGVELDIIEAAKLFHRASRSGNQRAKGRLTLLYTTFATSVGDEVEELKAYQGMEEKLGLRGEALGPRDRELNRGLMYMWGIGIQRDRVRAYLLFESSAKKGSKLAEELLKYCEPKLNETMQRKVNQMRGTIEVFGRK